MEPLSNSLIQLLVLVLLPALAGATWQVVEDLSNVPGISVTPVGPPQQPFARPLPRSVEATLLRDFRDNFNLLQDVAAEGDNIFTLTSEQYVASIPGGFVEGEAGLVYDTQSRVYHLPYFFFNRTSPLKPMPQRTLEQAVRECERHGSLASVVQKYGHMYYHFLEETLPRVALLLKAGLAPETKLLTWGQPYEYEYLEMLGIQRERIVPFDPAAVYCAEQLLIPTPTPRITPPREALLAAREALGVRTLPQEERQLVIYVSRAGEPTRRVSNEEQLLGMLKAVFPGEEVVVFHNSSSSPAQTIALFQRARIILGPHGAGLSHALFAAPGTALLEFLFLQDPPLMFWHASAALGQEYWLLPVPQAAWLQGSMEVPVDEVVDILTAILAPSRPAPLACPPGSFYIAGKCSVCPAGAYAFNPASWTCRNCFHGRVAPRAGSAYCITCPSGTYSDPSGRQCLPCPRGTYSPLPGAWDKAQCLTPAQRRQQMEDPAANLQQLAKLSPLFARSPRGRALIEALRTISAGDGSGALSVTRQDLCTALVAAGPGMAFADPYRGPYLYNSTALGCSPGVMASPDPYALPSSSPTPAISVVALTGPVQSVVAEDGPEDATPASLALLPWDRATAPPPDAAPTDAPRPDAPPSDAPLSDAAPTNAPPSDASPSDAAPPDAPPLNAPPSDAAPLPETGLTLPGELTLPLIEDPPLPQALLSPPMAAPEPVRAPPLDISALPPLVVEALSPKLPQLRTSLGARQDPGRPTLAPSPDPTIPRASAHPAPASQTSLPPSQQGGESSGGSSAVPAIAGTAAGAAALAAAILGVVLWRRRGARAGEQATAGYAAAASKDMSDNQNFNDTVPSQPGRARPDEELQTSLMT